MTTLKPFAQYKASGVEWIGDIPTDWNVRPVKTVFRERKMRSLPSDDHLTPSQTHGVLPQSEYMARTGNKVVLNLTGADSMRHVEPNDFISHLRSFQGGFEHSRLAGKVSAAYTVIEPLAGVVPPFFRYLFKSDLYIQALQTTTDQLRDGQSIRFAQIVLLPLPVPGLETQKDVASFLDRETSEIDAFIADQEDLIGLLAERRAATISHAVTKGLDPSVSMKDSGVGWMGEVPDHWAIGKVGFAYRLTLGKMVNASAVTGEPRPYLRAGNIQESGVDLREVKTMPITPSEAAALTLVANDVVVVEGGAGYGRSDVLRQDLAGWAFQNHVIRARAIGPHDSRFLDYTIKCLRVRGHFEALGAYATIPNLSSEKLAAIELPFLPVEEQALIADHLDHETAELNAAIADAREAIRLSRERRAALISAAVTGKIDVRGRA